MAESHEDFMKRTMGEDFWDKDVRERFEMVLRKCVEAKPCPLDELKERKREHSNSMET